MTDYRIAVIGDIHGNMPAFESARAAAHGLGYDRLVLMGDILSYGVDTAEVIAGVTELNATKQVTILRGNHDIFYEKEKSSDTQAYLDSLPAWIGESIEFTRASPAIERFHQLSLVDFFQFNGVYFAHANPFGRRDWRYLNSLDEHREAAVSLRMRQCCMGVFAHTHRPRVIESRSIGEVERDIDTELICRKDQDATWILNTGSIGQPRGAKKGASIVSLDLNRHSIRVRFIPIDYDVRAYMCSVGQTSLSDSTKQKLLSFFS